MTRTLPVHDEEGRIAALRAYEILDTEPEAAFDRIVRIARTIFDAPVAKITLIDRHRAWTKAVAGEERKEKPRWLTFCNTTIMTDQLFVVEDTVADARFCEHPAVTGGPHYRFYAGVPIRDRAGNPIGALCCFDHRPKVPTADQLSTLQDLAQMVVDALEMRLIATSDCLTGVMTKRAFIEAAQRDVSLAIRHGRPLSAMVVGIDSFDMLVQRHGHEAADQVMRRFGSLCLDRLRSSDYIGLSGVGQFAFILRETFSRDGRIVAERLRDAIGQEPFDFATGEWCVTTSTGMVGLGPRTQTAEGLLSAADQALSIAVAEGGCRTVMHERIALRGAESSIPLIYSAEDDPATVQA